jgi:hypothetical protein
MRAIINDIDWAENHIGISATLKKHNDVQLRIAKRGVTYSFLSEGQQRIQSGDLVEINYAQDWKKKQTKIYNLQGRFIKTTQLKPFAHFLLLPQITTKINFPKAFTFSATAHSTLQ